MSDGRWELSQDGVSSALVRGERARWKKVDVDKEGGVHGKGGAASKTEDGCEVERASVFVEIPRVQERSV
jgi:hypothetical protein